MNDKAAEPQLSDYFNDLAAIAHMLLYSTSAPLLQIKLSAQMVHIIVLVSSGAVSTSESLAKVLEVPRTQLYTPLKELTDLGLLTQFGSVAEQVGRHLVPTETSTRLFTALTAHRDAYAQLLTAMDPDELEKLTRSTRALRVVLEHDHSQEED